MRTTGSGFRLSCASLLATLIAPAVAAFGCSAHDGGILATEALSASALVPLVLTSCDETSFRSAVAAGGTVSFAAGTSCTLSLTKTAISIGSGLDVTIDGTGASVVIDGGGAVP